jgi:hypothetical protein
MSMIQIVLGAALGCIAAQGALFGLRQSIDWLQQGAGRARVGRVSASPGSSVVHLFVRYGAPVGVLAGLLTLGIWAVGDYMSGKSARAAALASADPLAVIPTGAPSQGPAGEENGVAPSSTGDSAAGPSEANNPYADVEFKVQHRVHRRGALSLKETLVQRSEARARADLLRETHQHERRSQYDCEAAERAGKYLKAGLDVWGFAAWQGKYFPMDSYKGATLPQCQDIQNVVDPAGLDLQATVAQDSHH